MIYILYILYLAYGMPGDYTKYLTKDEMKLCFVLVLILLASFIYLVVIPVYKNEKQNKSKKDLKKERRKEK